MSKPRRIIKGRTYMITRRCTQRTFLLKPGKDVNNIFLFCMAHAAEKYSISIHAFVVMSNHYHIILTDKEARLPDFTHWLDKNLAKALNSKYGRWENFWTIGSYSMQELKTRKDILYKMEYLALNPVRARLVHKPKLWPGLTSAKMKFGEHVKITRPNFYFREKGNVPKEVGFRLVKPPVFRKVKRAELDKELQERLEKGARQIVKDVKSKGGKFMGVRKVLKTSPFSRPGKRELRRNLSPRVTAKDDQERLQALSELYEFHQSYKAALARWRDGDRKVKFPLGTYKMRVFFGALCEEEASSSPG